MLGGQFSGMFKSRIGDHFHSVRGFLPQDPVKLIHWPATSKGLGIMVKEFNEQLSGRVSIMLGCGAGQTVNGETTLDWAARAAGSLAFSALDAGYQVESAALSDLSVLSVPPFADGNQILEQLSRLAAQDNRLTRLNLESVVERVSAKSGLCFVLTEVNSELCEFVNDQIRSAYRKVSNRHALASLLQATTIHIPG